LVISRKTIFASVGLLLSAIFLWAAVRDVDGAAVLEALRRARWHWIPMFIVSLAGFCWLKSARWALLLKAAGDIKARQLLSPVIIGYMGTGLMPMQLGEVARAYLAASQLQLRMATVFASLVLERVFDIFMLVLIIGLAALLGTEFPPEVRAIGAFFIALGVGTLAVLWLYAVRTELCLELLAKLTAWLPQGLRQKLLDHARAGAQGLDSLRNPTRCIALIVLSVAQWSCMCACTWISLAAIGLSLPAVAALVVLATTIISMTLPAGPGYVGTLQLAYTLALVPFAVERSDALAASVFYLVMLWVPLVALGLVLLHRSGFGMSDLAGAANKPLTDKAL
jgi:uncharacterized protein (TIRG00374 family)